MFRFFFSKPSLNRKPKGKIRNSSRVADIKKHPFAAVKITPSKDIQCVEALSKSKVFFLRNEAPLIPLSQCTHRQQCKCRYTHFKDRRGGEPRRESDL